MSSFTPSHYPQSKKGDVVDHYFGTDVADPYRWLEDDMSTETAAWVTEQNRVTSTYLEEIDYRHEIKDRLQNLWNYEKVSAPFTEGEYTYFYRNDGLQDQDVIYRQKGHEAPSIFLDPNTFSADGTASLAVLTFSKDGTRAAYSVSEGGSDWRKVYIIDTGTMSELDEPLVDIKFSGMAWQGSEGFYYSSYDKPLGSELSAKTDQHKLYFHRIGEPQANDTLIFGGTPAEKYRYVNGWVSPDDRFLIINTAQSTSSNNLYQIDLNNTEAGLVTIIDGLQADTYPLDGKGNTLYLITNLHAANQKVVVLDADAPQMENWQDLIPETQHVLSAKTGGGYLFASYMVDATFRVLQYNYDGQKIREIDMPGLGTVTGFEGKATDKTLYYTFTNYTTPGTIYSLDPSNGQSIVHRKSGAQFDSSRYESTQVFYQSADGTEVPMTIAHKVGLELNGKNPTILYGYGGFDISLTPEFSVPNAVWLEMGGVYCVANLRGGGEYGKQWHNAGTRTQKQNVFDDFISAAEYLFQENYTSKPFLAIRGGSNGGLLVGATMTQRPDLMQVALPAVGVLDMLRYHTFTAGAGWAYDYGTAEQSKEMFEYLKNYSPVHNVRENTHYPATLVTTGDHDDRVVPAHSFKFAATLQDHQAGEAPTLIRIETDAGHGAGTPVSKIVEQYADIFAFTMFNMGVDKVFFE